CECIGGGPRPSDAGCFLRGGAACGSGTRARPCVAGSSHTFPECEADSQRLFLFPRRRGASGAAPKSFRRFSLSVSRFLEKPLRWGIPGASTVDHLVCGPSPQSQIG